WPGTVWRRRRHRRVPERFRSDAAREGEVKAEFNARRRCWTAVERGQAHDPQTHPSRAGRPRARRLRHRLPVPGWKRRLLLRLARGRIPVLRLRLLRLPVRQLRLLRLSQLLRWLLRRLLLAVVSPPALAWRPPPWRRRSRRRPRRRQAGQAHPALA